MEDPKKQRRYPLNGLVLGINIPTIERKYGVMV